MSSPPKPTAPNPTAPNPSARNPISALNYTVGPPRPDDRARWRELYRAYAEFYCEAVTDTQLDLMWSWVTDPDHDVSALLARDPSGNAVGLAHYRPYYRPLAATVAGHLDDLFVEPAARGKGAVDALLEAGDRPSARLERDPLDITADDNYRARSTYDQVAERTTWVTYDMQVPPATS